MIPVTHTCRKRLTFVAGGCRLVLFIKSGATPGPLQVAPGGPSRKPAGGDSLSSWYRLTLVKRHSILTMIHTYGG